MPDSIKDSHTPTGIDPTEQAAVRQDQPDEELPNAETIAAMLEAERIGRDKNARSYTDLTELFHDLEQ